MSILAGYYSSWSVYDRKYFPWQIPEELTHLLYGFADLKEDGTVALTDPWADTDQHFEGDPWSEGKCELFGSFKQLALLKKKRRNLRVSLSVGGWTLSTHFAAVTADAGKRARLVGTAVELMNDLGLDGLDIDWEFPKSDAEAGAYVQLLYELRMALQAYAQGKGELPNAPYLLTVAVPCAAEHYSKLRLAEMARYIDHFYLMAYDFAGSWSDTADHQAALHGHGLCCGRAVHDYQAAGVPPRQLVLGLPAYGRSFLAARMGDKNGGVGKGSWEAGVYDYKDLPLAGARVHVDEGNGISWCEDGREVVSYDAPPVIGSKCAWARGVGLRGVMFWELSGDRQGEGSLISTAASALGGPPALDGCPNHLSFPGSKYENVRAGFP